MHLSANLKKSVWLMSFRVLLAQIFVFSIDLLSTPMGVDYVVTGFDMEVQPLVTHNAA